MFQHLPKLYLIEEKDEVIEEKLFGIIKEFTDVLEKFRQSIYESKINEKEFEINYLKKIIYSVKRKIKILERDIKEILNIENLEKEFITVKDYIFIKDKIDQLNRIKENLNIIEGILQEDPPADEFRNELLEAMENDINIISDSMEQIMHDDSNLEKIYSKISYL
ncbi:hypothetical protein JW949_00060 [Candidatus Woesearchaeota archaeon]|nr:hypothetical protein [Candidatus Woesearchaeota archaeon]